MLAVSVVNAVLRKVFGVDAQGDARVRLSTQLLNEDLRSPRLRESKLPIHGRAWVYAGDRTKLRTSWSFASVACRLTYSWSAMESEHMLALAFPPVELFLSLPVAFRGPWALKRNYEASWGIRIFDTALWWSWAENDNEWRNDDPWWRRGNWRPAKTIFGPTTHSEKIIETRRVTIPMPEGDYFGTATLLRWTNGRKRNPLKKVGYSVRIEFDDGWAIPFSGKGENSWDCGEDAVYASTMPCDSIGDGVLRVVTSVLRTRQRRGDPARWPKYPPERKPPTGGVGSSQAAAAQRQEG